MLGTRQDVQASSVPPRLRRGGTASLLGRLRNPSPRISTTPCLRGRARGLDSVAWDHSPDNLRLMPRAGRGGCNLTLFWPGPTVKEAGPGLGIPETAQAPACDSWPDSSQTPLTQRDARPSAGRVHSTASQVGFCC